MNEVYLKTIIMETEVIMAPSTAEPETSIEVKQKKGKGFAVMDKETQRAIATQGGKAAHKKGTAHRFTSDEAKKAGSKGGKTVSKDKEHMSQIGKLGVQKRKEKKEAERVQRERGPSIEIIKV